MTRDTPDPEPGETSPGPIPMHRLMASYRFDDDLARVLTAFQIAPPTLGATEARVRARVAVVSTVETQHTAWVLPTRRLQPLHHRQTGHVPDQTDHITQL